jgi:hypothetical protein
MGYYTFSVRQTTNEEGHAVFEVMEIPMSGGDITVVSTHNNEVDAQASAYYFTAYEKHRDHQLAMLATAKWLSLNGFKTTNVEILFFNKETGAVDADRAFRAIWERL